MKRLALIVLATVFAFAFASCGRDGDDGGPPRLVELVVPAGTQERIDRGETVQVMPAKLEFRVGDTFRIINEDSADQYVGPYLVRAGEQFELRYGAAGRYSGMCNLSGGASYEIVITD